MTIEEHMREVVSTVARDTALALARDARRIAEHGRPEVRLVTSEEACRLLAIGERTLSKMVNRGDLQYVGEGSGRRYRYDSIVQWIEDHTV